MMLCAQGQRIDVDMLGVALHAGTVDTLINELWLEPGKTPSGAKSFSTIGEIYRLSTTKDGAGIFAAALSDKVRRRSSRSSTGACTINRSLITMHD